MSNGTKSSFGSNLTAIIVALLGTVGAIGGAWISTYGGNNASRTEAAAAPVVSASTSPAQTLPADQASAIPMISPAPQPNTASIVAPAEDAGSAFLPNSTQIAYDQPWPNDRRVNQLVLETVEVADNVVRVHLRFDNTTGSPVKFYTSIGGQGIRSYITDKKAPQYPATAAGGALFADPTVVELLPGSSTRGWLEYATGDAKINSLNLHLESYTEGYPAGQSGTITYRPIKLKHEK